VEIVIEQVASDENTRAMQEVRRQVFEREMRIRLPPEGAQEGVKVSHLIARLHLGRQAVGTLSVMDTSGDEQLHASHHLGFEPGARCARASHTSRCSSRFAAGTFP
jgi:hypothetical protein